MDLSLKLIKKLLLNIIRQLEWNAENINGQRSTMRFSGLTNIRRGINDIQSLNLFTGIVEDIRQSAIYTTANDEMDIQLIEGRIIDSNLNMLKKLATNLLELF